jgi:hypothetical protein
MIFQIQYSDTLAFSLFNSFAAIQVTTLTDNRGRPVTAVVAASSQTDRSGAVAQPLMPVTAMAKATATVLQFSICWASLLLLCRANTRPVAAVAFRIDAHVDGGLEDMPALVFALGPLFADAGRYGCHFTSSSSLPICATGGCTRGRSW